MSIAEPKHEIVRFEPNKPIQSSQNLKSLLTSQKDSLAQALPRHVTPERIIKTMLVAANRVPDLLQCTQASILETINRAAELGLDLSGTLGEAYPVPFNNKVAGQWVKQCQLIIGYRGLAKLARQSGEIKRIEAEVVYEKDKFVYRKGSTFELDYYPCLEADRGAAVGAYALVQFKDGGIQAEFMPVSEIEKIRARSKAAWDRNGNPVGPWKEDWAEMARKTVFRRLAKWLPLSAEKWQEAIEHDNQQFDVEQVIAATPTPAPSLTAELMGSAEPVATPEPHYEPEPEHAAEQQPPKPKKKPQRKAAEEGPLQDVLAAIEEAQTEEEVREIVTSEPFTLLGGVDAIKAAQAADDKAADLKAKAEGKLL